MKIMLMGAVLASLSLTPAFAADTTTKPADAKPAKETAASAKPAPEQKLICTKEAEVGSIIAKKVCRTPEQVEADRRAAREVNDDRARSGGRPDLVAR